MYIVLRGQHSINPALIEHVRPGFTAAVLSFFVDWRWAGMDT